MKHEEIGFLSAVEMAQGVRRKQLSPVEVVQAILERIEHLNPSLNAFTACDAAAALETARRAEAAVMRGETLGPLHGVPVSIKDILYVKGSRTTFGSKLFEDNVTEEDTPSVARLRRAGAILIGRTNTPEFGWKGVTDNCVFGPTRNPWDLRRTPGGSSGGASAAVAAGLGPIGIGTDGGGSIRIPAAFCGLVGHKPSFGRVPNYPATAADSLRHTGPLTRTVADAALALQVLAGPDEHDPSSLPGEKVDYLSELERGIEGLRVAYSPDLGYARVDPEIARLCEKAATRLEETGALVDRIDVAWDDPYDCWRTFFYGGISGYLENRLEADGHLLDPGLLEIVRQGAKLRAADYVRALFERNAFWQKVRVVFETYDLLVTPSLAVAPFPIGQNDADPLAGQEPRPLNWTPFTYSFNLTGHPAASIPCGWTAEQLPVGLQIVGRRFDDTTVLRAARSFEQLEPWADRRPQVFGGEG